MLFVYLLANMKIIQSNFILKKKLLSEALSVFFDLREVPNLKKYPSTSEEEDEKLEDIL